MSPDVEDETGPTVQELVMLGRQIAVRLPADLPAVEDLYDDAGLPADG